MHSLDSFADNLFRLIAHKENPMANRAGNPPLASPLPPPPAPPPPRVLTTLEYLQAEYKAKSEQCAKLERELSALNEEIGFLQRHPGYEILIMRIAERLKVRDVSDLPQ